MQVIAGSWLQYFIYFLIAGNLAALVVGVGIVAEPGRLNAWFGTTGKPRSLRRATKSLEMPHNVDARLLARPRLLGAILLAAAALILVKGAVFVSGVSVAEGGRLLARFAESRGTVPVTWEVVWLSLVIFITLGALFAAAVGLLALTRTDLLAQWSALANRWVSSRRALKHASESTAYYGLDRLAHEQPRLTGALISLAALYVIGMLIWFLRSG
jgi:hypothetical protein